MTTQLLAPAAPARTRSQKIAEFVRSGLDRPLSEDDPDIFYPDTDGEPLAASDYQFYPMTETAHALRQRYRDRPDVYVACDLLVYYRMNDNSSHVAPDVFVVFGVESTRRRSYIIWREGGKSPDFVLEVASPGTYVRDLTEKRELYAALRVTELWRFDPTGECFTPELEADQLNRDGDYEGIPITLGEDGILRGHSAVLGLDICVLPGRELRLYDPVAGVWLRTPDESEANLRDAEGELTATRDELASTQGELTESLRANQALADRIRELEAQLQGQQGQTAGGEANSDGEANSGGDADGDAAASGSPV